MNKYRVIQWATGLAGKFSIEAIIRHPSLELVGVKVFSPEKVGMDAGVICGLAPIGVLATDCEEDLLALDADCIIHAGQFHPAAEADLDELCRLLRSGKNVITLSQWVYTHPGSMPPELRGPVEAACAEGNSTLIYSGLHPGFIVDAVATTMTASCRKVDRIEVRELLDYGEYETTSIPVDLLGFGRDRSVVEAFLSSGHYFDPSVHLLGQAMGVTVEKIEYDWDIHVAERDWQASFGLIKKGTVAAFRYGYTGYVQGQPRIYIEHVTRTNPAQIPEWTKNAEGYRISIKGEPSWEIHLRSGTGEGGSPFFDTYMAAANVAVNSVPAVCEAPPGIMTRLDLPMITGVGVLGGK